MSKKLYEESNIQGIASAIREKNGTQNQYTVAQMPAAVRAIKTQPDLEMLNVTENGNYLPSAGKDGFSSVSVDVESGEVVVQSLSVTQNGIYTPPSGVDGYAPVTVNVSGGGGSGNISGVDPPVASQGSNGQIYLQHLGVPSGYTFLESLSVTEAGPYIDTGVANSGTAYFEVESKWDSTPDNNSGIFGAQIYNAEFSVNAWQGDAFVTAGPTHLNITDPLQRHTLAAKTDGLYIDGTKGSPSVNWSIATGRNYYLFANNYSGGVLKSSNATIYHCRIYDNATIVREMYPAIRDSDNALGMYDNINDVFYENIGTGSFIAGPRTTFHKTISMTYCKVNDVWQPLIGTGVDDVSRGGGGTISNRYPTPSDGSNGDFWCFDGTSQIDVPSDATKVISIQTRLNNFIDTGIAANLSDLKIKIVLKILSIANCAILGASWSPNGFFFMVYNGKFRFHSGGVSIDTENVVASKTYVCEMDKSGITINGIFYPLPTRSGEDISDSIMIGYVRNGQGSGALFSVSCVEIYNGSELLANYAPCKNPSNVFCMYDAIDETYKVSATSVQFEEGSSNFINALYKKDGTWID